MLFKSNWHLDDSKKESDEQIRRPLFPKFSDTFRPNNVKVSGNGIAI